MTEKIDRRSILQAAGALGATTALGALAGCVGDDDGGDGDSSDDDGSADSNDTGDSDDTGDDMSDDDSGSMLDGREIQYGVLMPETGDLGSLGVTIRDGARLPARQLDGEVAAEFDVVTGDTQTDPQAGVSEANSMVDAGVPSIVGSASSNVNLQVTRESLIPNEVVGMSPSSTAPAVTQLEDDDYIFRTAPSDALQGPLIAQVAVEEFDASTVSTLFLNDDYGQALEESFVNAFESEHEGEALERVSFEPEQPSYSSQLETAMGADPDFLWVVGFPQSGIQLFRDFYDGYDETFPVIVPDGLIDSDLPDEVGHPMNNVWGTAPAADGPGAERFAELYEEEWGESPSVFNSHAYDAAAVFILANARAGENDGTAIRDNIREVANPGGTQVTSENLAEGVEMAAEGEDIEYQGASSTVEFDDNGDIVAASYDVVRYQEGEIETQRTVEDYQPPS